MKSTVLCILVVALLAAPALAEIDLGSMEGLINNPENHAALNAAQSTWTAGHNKRLDGMTFEDAKVLMGTNEQLNEFTASLEMLPEGKTDVLTDVPATFDADSNWASCKQPVRDQGKCGSCWAVSGAEAMSARACIQKQGNGADWILSSQQFVSCEHFPQQGCNGGLPPLLWLWAVRHGTPTEECYPYASGNGDNPPCKHTCADGSSMNITKVSSGTTRQYNKPHDIQVAIMNNGPVQGTFTVYQDFMSYTSGVYQHTSGSQLGGHAIMIVGWGTENGVDYWLVRNSWNTTWGIKGYFKIIRNGGAAGCGIDHGAVAGKMNV